MSILGGFGGKRQKGKDRKGKRRKRKKTSI
jgi:hypothetical protein